jgi:hypothetical protein
MRYVSGRAEKIPFDNEYFDIEPTHKLKLVLLKLHFCILNQP